MTQNEISEKLSAAISVLNGCDQSYDESKAVTFKPKNGDEARAARVVREGLAELGMDPGARGFFRLCSSAIEKLKPHGLDTTKAYELGRFKNEGVRTPGGR